MNRVRIFLTCLLILSVILAAMVRFPGQAVSGVHIPATEAFDSPMPSIAAFSSHTRAVGDLDGDGTQEEYLLVDHSLTSKEGEEYLWRTPTAWQVDSFALGDIDNDGTVNLVFTLWKTGSFETVKPFWQTGKDAGYKNHLFVYRLKDKNMEQVWCSSDLDRPVISFSIRDVDGDGKNELVIKEGQYRKVSGERYTLGNRALARTHIWHWDEWGFRLYSDIQDYSKGENSLAQDSFNR